RGSDKAEGECDRRARIAGHKPEQSLERRRKTPASSNRARLGTAGFKRRRTPMELYVGIDVAKDTLEVATSGGESFSAINDAAGRAQLIERLLKLNPALVVLEASGGYEQALLVELVAVDIDCARVNPVDVRYFARMHRQFAKTDRLDASSWRPLPSIARLSLSPLGSTPSAMNSSCWSIAAHSCCRC